jgi:hypothetical protein
VKTATIYCQRSGIAIAQVRTLCVDGFPFVKSMDGLLYHPMYNRNLDSLLALLRKDLASAREANWIMQGPAAQHAALCMSAILYSLGALQDDYACLPCDKVVIGSGARLLALANWYHHATTKRLTLPRYRPHRDNLNVGWDNLSGWLEACEEVRTVWETGKDANKKAADLTALTEKTQLAVRNKRTDLPGTWNWIALQLADNYPAGRIATWKDLWMNGDIEQENWCLDDVEDLMFAITECCDVGNEVMHYVSGRIKHLKEMIRDFYSSFTILQPSAGNSGGSLHPDLTETERAKEKEFFSEFDAQASRLTELPPEPQRKDFASMALFIKAQAQHRLLARRFSLQQTK